MRYILLIHSDHDARATLPPDEGERIGRADVAFTQSLIDSGEWLAGDPLQGTDTATTVRLRGCRCRRRVPPGAGPGAQVPDRRLLGRLAEVAKVAEVDG